MMFCDILRNGNSFLKVVQNGVVLWENQYIPYGYTRCLYVGGDNNCKVNFTYEYGDIMEFDMRFTKIGLHRQLLSMVYPVAQSAGSYFGINENGYFELGGGVAIAKKIDTNRVNIKVSRPTDQLISIQIADEIVSRAHGKLLGEPLMHMFTDIGVDYKILGMIEYYGVKVFRDNKMIMSLVPCLDEHNTPCFYDTVKKETLYSTSGTLIYELA